MGAQMYSALQETRNYVCKNSFDLFYGLYRYNPFSTKEMQRIRDAVENVDTELNKRLDAEIKSGNAFDFEKGEWKNSLGVQSDVDLILRKPTRALRIGIIGFGQFGQFLAQRFAASQAGG